MANGQATEQLVFEFVGDDAPLGQAINRSASALSQFAGFVFSWKGLVTGGFALVGIAAIRMARQAVTAAAVLDTAIREVATLLPETASQIGGLADRLTDLSTRVPEPPVMLTQAFYQVVSAGITDTAEAFQVLEVASKASVAGLSDTFTAVDAITTVLNAYQLSASEATRVSDVFFATVRQGKLRFEDIAGVIGDVATSAALTGVSIEELGGALATMTQFGIDASEAATALNRFLLSVVQASDEQQRKAKALGIEFNTTALRTRGLAGFMRDLNEATDGNIDLLAELVPQIRSARAAFILAGDGASVFAQNVAVAEGATGDTIEAFNELVENLQTQATLIRNRITRILIQFGQTALPSIIKALSDFNRSFETTIERQIRLLEELGRTGDALRLRQLQFQVDLAQQAEVIDQQFENALETLREVARFGERASLSGFGVGAPPSLPTGIIRDLARLEEGLKEAADLSEVEFRRVVDEAEAYVAELLDAEDLTREQVTILLDFQVQLRQILRLRQQITDLDAASVREQDPFLLGLRREFQQQQDILTVMQRRKDVSEEEIKAQRNAVNIARARRDLREAELDLDRQRERTGAEEATQDAINRILAQIQSIRDASDTLTESQQANIAAYQRQADELQSQVALQELRNQLERELDDLEAGRERETPIIPDAAELEAAQNRLAELNRQAAILAEFDIVLLDDAPEQLRSVIQEIINVDAEIRELASDIQTAGDTTGAATQKLRALRDERAQLEQQGRDLAETLEGQIDREALRAKERLEDLLETRRLLAEFGLEGIADVPVQALAAVDRLGEVREEIEKFDEQLTELRATKAELEERARELERAQSPLAAAIRESIAAITDLIVEGEKNVANLRAQEQEATRAAERFSEFKDALREFPELDLDILGQLSEAGRGFLEAELDTLAELRRERDNTQAEFERLAADEAASTREVADAKRDAEEAAQSFERAVQRVARNLRLTGNEARLVAAIMRALGFDKVVDDTDKLAEALQRVARVARGLLGVASALEAIGEEARSALQGVVDLADGIAAIKTGDPVGGIFQALGGIAQIAGGLFGESERDRRLRESLVDLTVSLDRLRNDMERLRQVFAELTGRQLRQAENIAEIALPTGEFRSAELQAASQIDAVRRELEALGISLTDLAAIAAASDIPIDDLIKLLIDPRAEADMQVAIQQFEALQKAIREFSLSRALETFAGQMDLLRREFQLFGIEDPLEQLDLFLQKIAQFAPELAQTLAGLDLTTPEGRAEAERVLQRAFEAALEGEFPEDLRFDEFLDVLGDARGFLDAIAEDMGETTSFTVSRSITEVTGNRIVGALTTISIIEQLQLAVLREILTELGGTVPEDVAAISFRAPGVEEEILTVEQQQLDVLKLILETLGGTLETEEKEALITPTQEEVENLGGPTPQPHPPPPVMSFGPGSVQITIQGTATEEDGRRVGRGFVEEVDREMEERRLALSRAAGSAFRT